MNTHNWVTLRWTAETNATLWINYTSMKLKNNYRHWPWPFLYAFFSWPWSSALAAVLGFPWSVIKEPLSIPAGVCEWHWFLDPPQSHQEWGSGMRFIQTPQECDGSTKFESLLAHLYMLSAIKTPRHSSWKERESDIKVSSVIQWWWS